MKIDLHTHSYPGCLSAEHFADEMPELYLKAGMDAFVLTNHCNPRECNELGYDPEQQAKNFVKLYERCYLEGRRIGIRVFFGVEVKLINEPNTPEFLLYGLSEQDFLLSYPLYKKTQKDLFEYCERENVLMVQAHPFRSEQGFVPADLNYLHGIEVYNPYITRDPRLQEGIDLAKKEGKIMTAGSDFHHRMQIGTAGMIIPDQIYNQYMLRDYLRESKPIIFDTDGIIYDGNKEE